MAHKKNVATVSVMIMIMTIIVATIVGAIVYFSFFKGMYTVEHMEPTFKKGERVLVDKRIYHSQKPKLGDFLAFKVPERHNLVVIRRVVAIPGDRIMVKGDDVIINGKKIAEPYLEKLVAEKKAQGAVFNTLNAAEVEVPSGKVYVLGDNRPRSLDSRDLGPIDLSQVVGKVE